MHSNWIYFLFRFFSFQFKANNKKENEIKVVVNVFFFLSFLVTRFVFLSRKKWWIESLARFGYGFECTMLAFFWFWLKFILILEFTLDSSICLGRPLKSTAIFIIFCHATHNKYQWHFMWRHLSMAELKKQTSAPNSLAYLIVCDF